MPHLAQSADSEWAAVKYSMLANVVIASELLNPFNGLFPGQPG